jgi:very-short-patch-repair endonuclease
MAPEQRAAQVADAHTAARGSKRTLEQLVEHARALERIGGHDSPAEALMAEWLAERGEPSVPQKAIGKYNVDLAVAPVAVEILGGGWHSVKKTHAIRTPEILNAGWHLAFVWNYEGRSALTEQAADHVVAWLNEVRRDPPAIGQYRVVSGDGELLAAGRADDPQFALEPPPRGRQPGRPRRQGARR